MVSEPSRRVNKVNRKGGRLVWFNKMSYDSKSGIVIYRSKMHATLKRNCQLMPALKCEVVSS